MKNKKWQKISTERVFDHKYFKVNKDVVLLADEREIEWYYWFSPDSSLVVPVTSDNKIVMIKQYRYLPNQVATEFPSGRSNKDESFEECARRELMEETGYSCGEMIKLGEFYETMAQLNRRIHIYLALNAVPPRDGKKKFSSDGPGEYEETETVLYDTVQVLRMVAENKIVSMGSSLAILLAQKYLKENA